MRLVVCGAEPDVGRIYGGAFSLLGAEPIWLNPDQVVDVLALEPDALLLGLEWLPSWRLAAAQARRAGIPVIYVMDGVIEWSYVWNNQSYVKPQGTVLQPLLASALCVLGRRPARLLATLGLADRIHIIGLPRLDQLKPVREVDRQTLPRIVVATPRTPGHNVDHRLQIKRALRDLIAFFLGRSDLHVVWRLGPEIARELGVVPSGEECIKDDLRRASGLISFTSTALLEGMAFGLPTAQIEYRAVPMYVQTAWEIRCAEHIPGVVQELLYPPVEKMAYQDSCLEDELEPGNASDKLAEVIHDEIGRTDADTSIGLQPSAIYPRIDYRQVHSHISAFSTTPQSVAQYELEAAYQAVERERKAVRDVVVPLRQSAMIRVLSKTCEIVHANQWRRLLDGLNRL